MHKELNKKIEAELFSAQPDTVISALNYIKEEGNIHYLPLLFDLLKSGPKEKVEEEITAILGTLKVREAVPVLVKALTEPKYIPIRKQLAAACWQNGLDYENHLQVFVDLVIEEDWETGFEAFTVIENMENFPGKEITGPAADKALSAIKDAGEQKKYFLHEILTMIR